MLDTIPVPADSKFGAMVARRLNASRPIAPAGSLAMSGPTGTGFAPPPTNLRDRRTVLVFPYAVRWAQSANDGSGAWIIWLPEHILTVAGLVGDPSDGLDDVGGDYPTGWYLLESDALDPDDGGTLYLIVTGGDEVVCRFSSMPDVGTENTHSIAICHAVVDPESGARAVCQLVTSAIVIAASGEIIQEHYFADDRSLSLVSSTSGEVLTHGRHFYINGFGRFTVSGQASPYGIYVAPSEAVIRPGETTDFAVLVRTGNTSSPDGNFIGYRKLRLDLDNGHTPFEYVRDVDDEGRLIKSVVARCQFVFDGQTVSLPDFDATLMTGRVYLRGIQPQPPEDSETDPPWSWTLGTAPEEAPEGGKAINLPIYDFANGKVEMDWRTTFLTVSSGGDGSAKGVRSVNGQDGKLRVVGGENIEVTTADKKITISYKEGKDPDEDPKDPCQHDDSGSAGGVGADTGAGGAGGVHGGGGGGVIAGGDEHSSDDDCCRE